MRELAVGGGFTDPDKAVNCPSKDHWDCVTWWNGYSEYTVGLEH